jgi:hypothetical protein
VHERAFGGSGGISSPPFYAVLLGVAIQKQPEIWLDAQLRAQIGTFSVAFSEESSFENRCRWERGELEDASWHHEILNNLTVVVLAAARRINLKIVSIFFVNLLAFG